jgi:transcriptional antiterminator RfaH
VPAGVVETLMQSVDSDGSLRFTSAIQPGSRVRLASGPFADALGVLKALDASGRVEVLLEMLGGSVKLKADVAQIALAS